MNRKIHEEPTSSRRAEHNTGREEHVNNRDGGLNLERTADATRPLLPPIPHSRSVRRRTRAPRALHAEHAALAGKCRKCRVPWPCPVLEAEHRDGRWDT